MWRESCFQEIRGFYRYLNVKSIGNEKTRDICWYSICELKVVRHFSYKFSDRFICYFKWKIREIREITTTRKIAYSIVKTSKNIIFDFRAFPKASYYGW